MEYQELSNLLNQPEVRRAILGNYKGPFSIGVILDPNNENQYVIRVRIEGNNSAGIRREYQVQGKRIPVVVNTNFNAPIPLTRR